MAERQLQDDDHVSGRCRAVRRQVFGARLIAGLVLLVALSWLDLACGAKTGLRLPDAGAQPDAAVASDCIDLPFGITDLRTSLQTLAQIGRADVNLLIDVTTSMEEEIEAIRKRLRELIVPAIRAQIPDSRLGVASFADFPQLPYGRPGLDTPFELQVWMTDDVLSVQGAVDGLQLQNGEDGAESQVEALYQLATGEGLAPWISPAPGCLTGGFGYACFRRDALPVVLLFTDAPFHNGPGGKEPYRLEGNPHLYEETREVLRERNMRVLGFFSGEDAGARRDLEVLARDTAALDQAGQPLVYSIGSDGNGLGSSVVDAIKVFASTVVFDIDVLIRDPDPTDGVDVLDFIQAIEPVAVTPADAVASIDREAGIFRGVRAGGQVTFDIVLRNDSVAPGVGPQVFDIEVIFRGDGRTILDVIQLQIVVPGLDGSGCGTITPTLVLGG